MIKKLIAIVLLLTLVVVPTCSVPTYADSIGNIEEDSNATLVNNYNKIHFYFDSEEHATIDSKSELRAALNALEARTEEYAAYNAQAVDDINDDLHITVEFASDFTQTKEYLEFAEEAQTLTTHEEVLDFRQRLNDASLEFHANVIDKNIHHLSVFESNDINAIDYSPFVIVIMDPEDLTEYSLTTLCDSDSVSNISLSYEPVAEADADYADCLDCVDAYEIVSANNIVGHDIRIGVYEAGGICDTSNYILSDKNIIVNTSGSNSSISAHATQVTTIIATMAPGANIYVSGVETVSGQRYGNISWFLQNNCDIINCSFSYYENSISIREDGVIVYDDTIHVYRHDIDGFFDYIIRAHLVTICKSAGNKNTNPEYPSYNPQGMVTSPGYAYNVITVGGVDLINDNWVHAPGACYKTSTYIIKPTVSAPYTVDIPGFGEKPRTSFSTPMVAACIALLEQVRPWYRTNPHAVTALVASTANKNADYTENFGNYNNSGDFNEKTGAGIISIEGMLRNVSRTSFVNSNRYMDVVIFDQDVHLTTGDELQAALAYIVTTNKNVVQDEDINSTYRSGYTLRLYSPSNSLLEFSSNNYSNLELIRYTATETGTYRLEVFQSYNMNTRLQFDPMTLIYDVK